ncbi:DNA phosphorothioation-dependent restriction protein DptG [uncultured Shewanella sp.]|uniref:DNA phosphorothioation-dependent restriction protein DptG n=1 Tax=uncultured Shewanella sp. TaxID=173975 RepID=UPI002623A81C|nr:DNA phosphorothioation-dependent restriction protein DptG [uncultured Shewanella sp.]
MIKNQLTPPRHNTVSTYLPLRSKDKHYKFCWDTVLGYFTHVLYDKSLVTKTIDDFKKLCKIQFESKLDEPEFWLVLEQMYFEEGQVFNISPELLMFKAVKGEIDTNSQNLGEMYAGLLNGFTVPSSAESQLNFLEKEIKTEFDSFYVTGKNNSKINVITPYLPFLTHYFQQDLLLLSKRPHYFISNFNLIIRLYGFLFVTQMALNIKDWANNEPKNKPCFFILDNEKASDERLQVKNYGYSQLHHYLEYLFPYLAMNEALQEKGQTKPLWMLATYLKENDHYQEEFFEFANDFKSKRNLTKEIDARTSVAMLAELLELSHQQFLYPHGTPDKIKINETVVKGILGNICEPFIQHRGRAGQVLTFNQDYIVLLTNLAIGEKEKLRLHELVKAFEARGVFFDEQSQQSLIDFYERMGNVERMSDSGDAVYVKKTV